MKNSVKVFGILLVALLSVSTATAYAQARTATPNTFSFASLPTSFTIPAGWKVAQQEGDLVALVPNTQNPELIVIARAGMYQDADAFYTLAGNSLRDDLKVQNAQIVQNPSAYQVNGMNASSAVVAARGQTGETVKIGLSVVISANKMGLGVVVLAPATKYEQGKAVADAVLQSARFGTMNFDRKAAAGLFGRWVKAAAANSGNRNSSSGGWSSGSNVTYVFYEDGTYQYASESFASVDVPGAGGLSTSKDSDSGRYYVSNGQITLVGSKNGSQSLTYRVVDAKYIQIGNAYFARR